MREGSDRSVSKKTAAKKLVKKKSVISTGKKRVVKKPVPKETPVKTAKKAIRKRVVLSSKKIETQDLDLKYTGAPDKWLIVQLSEDCDLKESAEEVVQQLKDLCGEAVEFFIPMHIEYVKDKPIYFVLFEGYIFVRLTNDVTDVSFKDRTGHISGPLLSNGKNQHVHNKDINGFKREIKKRLKAKVPTKGQKVIPKVGDYKNLEGEVLSVDKKSMIAVVEFALASRVVEVQIRIINLDIME
jgi:transcription antitermination factor NusG